MYRLRSSLFVNRLAKYIIEHMHTNVRVRKSCSGVGMSAHTDDMCMPNRTQLPSNTCTSEILVVTLNRQRQQIDVDMMAQSNPEIHDIALKDV